MTAQVMTLLPVTCRVSTPAAPRVFDHDHIGFWVRERDAVYEEWQTHQDATPEDEGRRR